MRVSTIHRQASREISESSNQITIPKGGSIQYQIPDFRVNTTYLILIGCYNNLSWAYAGIFYASYQKPEWNRIKVLDSLNITVSCDNVAGVLTIANTNSSYDFTGRIKVV